MLEDTDSLDGARISNTNRNTIAPVALNLFGIIILLIVGRGAVVNVLVLHSWCRWFDPPLLQSFGWNFKPSSRLHDLVVSGTLN